MGELPQTHRDPGDCTVPEGPRPQEGGGGGHAASIQAWTPSDSMKTKQIKTIYPQRKTTLPFKLQINQNIFFGEGGWGWGGGFISKP